MLCGWSSTPPLCTMRTCMQVKLDEPDASMANHYQCSAAVRSFHPHLFLSREHLLLQYLGRQAVQHSTKSCCCA